MFSISFVVCIISTILIVQIGHCEEKLPQSSPAVVVMPVPHTTGDVTKVGSTTEVKSTANSTTASSSNSAKGLSVEDIHSRKIKNTSIDYAPQSVDVKNGTDDKATQQNPQVTEQKSASKDKKIATTKIPSLHANSDIAIDNQNGAKVAQTATTKTTATPAVKPSSNSTITSTTTTTKTTTTTTTTMPAPKKPTVTFSVEDLPDLLNSVRKTSVTELRGDDNEPRSLQSSESLSDRGSGHDFLVPVIGMIFIVPFLIIVVNCTTRRIRDYWSKRKYRRMDYLIEDMYN